MLACTPNAVVDMWATYEDDLKEHLLVDLHELLVPLVDVGRLLTRVRVVVLGGGRVVAVVVAPLENLFHNGLVDLRAVSICVMAAGDGARSRWGWGWPHRCRRQDPPASS